jgi:tRNA (pseudouridine54-N1)-methyltransferase
MQIIILLDAPRTRTDNDFLIRDVPGTSGRLDVVCRILIAAYRTVPIFTSCIQVNAIFGGPPHPPLLLRVDDVNSEEFLESELSCALIVKGLLHNYRTRKTERSRQWPQFSIMSKSFDATLKEVARPTSQLIYLVEKGQPLDQVNIDLDQPITLILGDDQGLPEEHEKLVHQYPVQEVSIGTRSLLGSQVVSLFLLEMAQRMKSKRPNKQPG